MQASNSFLWNKMGNNTPYIFISATHPIADISPNQIWIHFLVLCNPLIYCFDIYQFRSRALNSFFSKTILIEVYFGALSDFQKRRRRRLPFFSRIFIIRKMSINTPLQNIGCFRGVPLLIRLLSILIIQSAPWIPSFYKTPISDI